MLDVDVSPTGTPPAPDPEPAGPPVVPVVDAAPAPVAEPAPGASAPEVPDVPEVPDAPAAVAVVPERRPTLADFVPPPPVVRDEEAKREALRRMKRLALLALVVAAVGFVTLHLLSRALGLEGSAAFWVGFVAALFEAAMVGALADWFAVTALFRHPMGIPIPHTAIIRTNKDRIGNALANFVGHHFLTPENVMARLERVNFAEIAGAWLNDPDHLRGVRQRAVEFVEDSVGRLGDDRISAFVERELIPRLQEVALAPRLSDLLLQLAKDGQHEAVLDELLKGTLGVAAEHKDTLRALIRARLPGFVPDGLVDVARDAVQRAIESTLDEMIADREHPLRLRVHAAVQGFVEKLEHDEATQARVDAWRDRLLANPAIQEFALARWHDFKTFLARDLRDEDSRTFAFLEGRAVELGHAMLEDEAFQRAVNEKVESAAAWAIKQHGHRVPDLIRDTIRRWDADTISEQVELAVGRDLQYIRLNGTLVGGLVGGVLYLLEALLG
ncbi:MAG TPA: DUF445 domain-containing protein [Rhodothermales bacterium]|nr:DUF445 domain-containing protein [Rhodothermales bacterium]